ncbi:MAG: hypothetical protein A3B16_00060 [Candidatus Zambryskibacteria bacterium RIFCSPLOWO2_01_FULL_45_43]|uniref:Endolytic murein transglycosylase n=1 Tax=Candidatus Zambryskibacteria bacterium RIFCSPLOWO2_01_FULL_45_43 TaxID=1802762 RepID=A0A1G2U7N1_9BACT|nr:MAG: hypothetical protein A3B16_00060 [Candidatus Zambryskibacteria bacterium RIFCSPLOWO2_01_FULL_45_43]
MRLYIFYSLALLLVLFLWRISPPISFPVGNIIIVPEGLGLHALGKKLEKDGVIRSPFWFRIAAIFLGGERDMKAGQYNMSRRENSFIVAWRIAQGRHDIETVKLTIPEGFTNYEISNLFDERFQFFHHASFLVSAPEGYLFPDTYFIPVTATASSTIKLLTSNFERKTKDLKINADIVVMASLLEGEAKEKEEREIASGILWKRLKMGMPLQVDIERTTYEFPGLPEAPINNPGLVSIKAALNPTTSPYLYFLTDNMGKMHYAKSFDEHKTNIDKYLR